MLQKKLTDLENGVPLEDVLGDLPAEAKDLESLIRLAAVVRTVPHPEPVADQVAAQRQQVMAAAVLNTRPIARPQPKPERTVWNWFGTNPAAAAIGAAALFFAVILAGSSFWLSNRQMDSARVESITGQVQVAANRAGTDWKNISAGYRLSRNDRLRTLGASSATLVFFEDTHTFVSANSDLSFAQLNGSSGDKIQVHIDLKTGEAWNQVTPLKGEKSFFLVNTPAGTASVHGTSFGVKVSQTGQAQFAVKTGEVRVQNDGSEVTLLAGQVTTANLSGEIAEPTYQFNVQGSLLAADEETGIWEVSGVQFKVDEATIITGGPELSGLVKVSGRILDDHSRVADTIEPASDSSQAASFTGALESNQGDTWTIGGMPVLVTAETQLDENLEIGSPVNVSFNILEDGAWVAVRIETLVEEPEEPGVTPTATADPQAMPSYEFAPDEVGAESCGNSDFNLTGTLRNTSGDAKDYAANVQLGYLIDRGGEYVRMVELTPASWTRIDAGQTVTFNINVTMNEAWATAPEESEVKLRIFIASATNRSDHLTGRLTVTLVSGCAQTPTPTVAPTPEITGTPEIIPTVGEETPVVPQAGTCTGADPHPTGMTLSQRYSVTYDEIMNWFCQHYGFGEIDLGYSLSRQTGKPVQEIFAMRASGMGWGEIKKLLLDGDKPGKGPNDKKDKPDKPDKKKP